jgi:isopentenyl phosphate kinase
VILLKLGGSLITEKARPLTAKHDIIQRLADEIATAMRHRPELELIVGHGSGSFGHSVAARHGTHRGARSEQQWRGFIEVWVAAQALNHIVLESLQRAGLPALTFSPSASAICRDGELIEMAVEPIRSALQARMLPVVHGDVSFDRSHGAAIVSTEQVFVYLARHFQAERALLAGIEEGVYADYPTRDNLLPRVSDEDLQRIALDEVQGEDVTGGMEGKLRLALALSRTSPEIEVRFFSGLHPGSVEEALLGSTPGTHIVAQTG